MRVRTLTACVLLSCGPAHVGPSLPGEVVEPSGLVRSRQHPGVFWTHGDSLTSSRLFAVNERGEVLARVELGVPNVDWEDIAVDDAGNLYVGEFGNNFSSREDLKVYRLPEPDPANGDTKAEVEATFRFRFANQTSFMPREDNFDVEALFVDREELFVFSKHRADRNTVLYRLPKTPGDVAELEPLIEFAVGDKGPFAGMVTAADLHPKGEHLAVLSYHAVQVFAWKDGALGERLALRPLVAARVHQIEALAWDDDALVLVNEDGHIFRMADPLAQDGSPFPAK